MYKLNITTITTIDLNRKNRSALLRYQWIQINLNVIALDLSVHHTFPHSTIRFTEVLQRSQLVPSEYLSPFFRFGWNNLPTTESLYLAEMSPNHCFKVFNLYVISYVLLQRISTTISPISKSRLWALVQLCGEVKIGLCWQRNIHNMAFFKF